jgi:DNA-binding MarR family transcriptional regulator
MDDHGTSPGGTAADDSADPTEVAAALRLAVGRIARRVRQSHAVGELTLSERSVLARLDREGPASPGALAEAERVRPQAMATTLAAMEERGLVSRRPDPADGRRAVLTISDEGRRLMAERRSESVRSLAAVLERDFTPTERAELLAVLPLLDRLAERL